MHRPAAIDAAPSPEKEGSVPTRLADHTLLLQGRRYPEARCAGQSTGAVQTAPLLATTEDFLMYLVQQHSIRRGTAPWATGLTKVMEAALTGISGMLFVCFLLSVVWLSTNSLRGIRRGGDRHGLFSLGPAWAVRF